MWVSIFRHWGYFVRRHEQDVSDPAIPANHLNVTVLVGCAVFKSDGVNKASDHTVFGVSSFPIVTRKPFVVYENGFHYVGLGIGAAISSSPRSRRGFLRPTF